MSELLKKYESIDQSKLNEATIKILNRVKSITADFTADDEKNNKIAEQVLNEVMKKNPDSVKIVKRTPKAKPAPKKAHKAMHTAKGTHKTTSTAPTKTSNNNIMSVAKEIQKSGESWKEAMERAKVVLKERREQGVQKQKTELEKLYNLVKTKKELQGFANSDIRRDAKRDAKPRGARFVSKEGSTSNAYGTFPNKIGRKYWETRDRHADRLAPNYPKDMPLLANGGTMWTKEKVENEITHYKNLLKNIDKYPNYNKKNVEKIISEYEEKLAKNEFADGGAIDGGMNNLTIQNVSFADGGSVSNLIRMYNFLKDDLVQLEEAIKSGDFEEVNRFFSYWLGSSGHLSSLKTMNNQRMYMFLQEDLFKLRLAVENNDTEEVERFFSYWLGSSGHLVSIIGSDIVPLVQNETAKIWEKNNPTLTAGVPPENFEKNWRKTQDEAIEKLKNEGKIPEDLKFEDIGFMTKNFEKGGIFYKEGSNKYGLGNTEIFVQEENDMYCVYDNVYNDKSENWEIKKLADFDTMDEAKEFAIEHSKKEYANGGSLPFMTDPNFGNFQNTGAFEDGGLNESKEINSFIKKLKDNSVVKEVSSEYGVSEEKIIKRLMPYVKVLKYNDGSIKEISIDFFDKFIDKKVKEKMTFDKFELGGAFMMTDLAGHTGGSDGLGNPMPLSGVSGTYYTGLVGETGAMSSGELFENGGGIEKTTKVEDIKNAMYKAFQSYLDGKTSDEKLVSALNRILGKRKSFRFFQGDTMITRPINVESYLDSRMNRESVKEDMQIALDTKGLQIYNWEGNEIFEAGGAMAQNQQVINDASQSYVNYYLGEGASQGIYAKGGGIPNNYEGRTPEEIWNSLSKPQRSHFLYDHVSEIEEYKNIERLPSSEIIKAYNSEWSSLDKDIKNRFTNHTREGQYASGGSLGKALYVEYSSYFTYNNYDEEKIMSVLESIGAKNIRLENDRGWFNQPEVVVFNGDKNKAQDALNEAFDTDYIRVSEKDWRTKKMADGGFTPDVSDGTQFMSGVYANGGGIRSKEELKKIFSEKEAIVKNLTPKQIAEMWNKNSYGVKQGISKPITIEEAKKPSMKIYLENLLIENELTEEEQAQYFAKGGSVDDSVIDELFNGYASAVLFTETDSDSGEPLDSEYSISDFDKETVTSTKKMLAEFYSKNKEAIEESELDLDTIGNDIWYTRSGQGAGFFDHSLDSEVEEKLIKGAKALGEYPSVETYDGKISIRGGRTFAKGGFVATVEFNVGDIVWDKGNKTYGTVMNNFGDPINGDGGELRLDSDGMQVIFLYDKSYENRIGYNLVKLGDKGDAGKFTPVVLDELKASAERMIKYRRDAKDKEGVKIYQEIYKRTLDGEFDSMVGRAKATASTKKGSNDYTYVPNKDVKELSVVLKGELKKLMGSDILDGVYVKNSAKSTSKVDADAVFAKILKDAKEAKSGKTKKFTATDLKKLNLEMVQKLVEAGYTEQQIRNVIFGYAFDNEIVADNELEYDNGVFSYEESYVKEKIDDLVEAQKNKEFVAGIEYPDFDWQNIIKKYKITSKPKQIVIKRNFGSGRYIEYYYEVFVGENIALGHNFGYKDFESNGKLTGDYIEKGKKVSDPTKQNAWQKERGQKAGFNGGYWYIVSSKIETIDDVLKTLLSQKDGYCKELELYSDSFPKTLKENKIAFADGGFMNNVYANGGKMEVNDINSELEDFDLDNLDPFETMQYDNYSKSMSKVDALQILINTVEGDYSQLSPELAELAEMQISQEQWNESSREMYGYAKGGMMAKGGKLDSGIYRVGKPTKISSILYEQKIVEIFDNGDISTASDYGRKLSDFKSQKYPIITKEQLDAQYKMANGGGFANDPFYKAFMEKRDKLYAQLKSRVVRAVGIDEAMEFFDADLTIAPYRFLERAVQSNLIALDEINKELVDSAMEESREIDNDEDLEEIGSSDFTYYLQHVLDGAGFKVGFVNDRLQRLNEDGSVKEISNNFADGGFMNDVYADGGDMKNVGIQVTKYYDRKKGKWIMLKDYVKTIPYSIFSDEASFTSGITQLLERDGYPVLASEWKFQVVEPQYADGGMFEDNDGFMRADNNNNYRYPEKEVYIETLDEPIDLTSTVTIKSNEVVISPIDENIDLNDDNRVRARMTQSSRGTAENFSKINPRAFEFIDLPMPTSHTHKND
jgi:hypothetical protein